MSNEINKEEISEIDSLPNVKIQKLLKEIYFEGEMIHQEKYRVAYVCVFHIALLKCHNQM